MEQDYKVAFRRLKEAADQGNALGQFNLGECYSQARGVEQDQKEAVRWYKEAAEKGVDHAQISLGVCYTHGCMRKVAEWNKTRRRPSAGTRGRRPEGTTLRSTLARPTFPSEVGRQFSNFLLVVHRSLL